MSDKLSQNPKPKLTQQANEVVIDGRTYRSVNNATIQYSVHQSNTRKDSALIDRAEADVRIITKSGRTVDVQGIDNHQVPNIPIVTCAGIITTQRGPVIAILNQFAHIAKGASILSSGQMEHFKIDVDDRSSEVNGTQRIITPDGFIIPLEFKNGLPYMPMRPPTDRELLHPGIPHVVLTSDQDWDPSVLDSAIADIETWAQSVPDDTADESTRPFDHRGNLKTCQAISLLDDTIDLFTSWNEYLPTDSLYEVHSRSDTNSDCFESNTAELHDGSIHRVDVFAFQAQVYSAVRTECCP